MTSTGAARNNANDPQPDGGADLTRVHFVGIGGAGMSGLARILLERGAQVSGSDQKDSAVVESLRKLGARVAIGHREENLELSGASPTTVVISFAAIPASNPELVAARERGVPVIRRSDLLAGLMAGHRQVLFAGTHGKTSTTSMAVEAFQAAGLDPSFAIGGQLSRDGVGAHAGGSDVFLAEADESDGSFLSYRPTVAVVTNIEPDHLDYFHTAEAYCEVFDRFAERLAPGGTLVVCLNDAAAARLGERALAAGSSVVGYGSPEAATEHPDIPAAVVVRGFQASEAGSLVQMEACGKALQVHTHVPGEHMALNAAAALAAGILVGGDAEAIARGLSAYSGVRRRFELRGAVNSGPAAGSQVFDDYAHHPTEVAAVLTAARNYARSRGDGPVVVAFQPHLYSRTEAFAAEFAEALSLADRVVVLDVFGARESPRQGVDGRLIAQRVQAQEVRYVPDLAHVPRDICDLAEPNSVILTMGAGSVTSLAEPILRALQALERS